MCGQQEFGIIAKQNRVVYRRAQKKVMFAVAPEHVFVLRVSAAACGTWCVCVCVCMFLELYAYNKHVHVHNFISDVRVQCPRQLFC